MSPQLQLPEVDAVSITVLMDNSIDILMAGSEVVQRFPLRSDLYDHRQPLAEHGFSALIRVTQGQKTGTVLFDTGLTRQGILHNIDALDINLHDVQAIILSHGPADHAIGYPGPGGRLA